VGGGFWEGRGKNHGDGHDGGVGDVDCAYHVGAVWLGGELDGEFCDVEIVEFVQAWEDALVCHLY